MKQRFIEYEIGSDRLEWNNIQDLWLVQFSSSSTAILSLRADSPSINIWWWRICTKNLLSHKELYIMWRVQQVNNWNFEGFHLECTWCAHSLFYVNPCMTTLRVWNGRYYGTLKNCWETEGDESIYHQVCAVRLLRRIRSDQFVYYIYTVYIVHVRLYPGNLQNFIDVHFQTSF